LAATLPRNSPERFSKQHRTTTLGVVETNPAATAHFMVMLTEKKGHQLHKDLTALLGIGLVVVVCPKIVRYYEE
jgi:hypothetical protein